MATRLHIDLAQYAPALKVRPDDRGRRTIYDPIRKQYMVLAPEEMIRQLLVQHLIEGCGYPASRIAVECGLHVNGMQRRCDVLVYTPQAQPWLLIECKAPKVRLDQAVFEQIAAYNQVYQVPYLMVTNGATSYCCVMDYTTGTYRFLEALPGY